MELSIAPFSRILHIQPLLPPFGNRFIYIEEEVVVGIPQGESHSGFIAADIEQHFEQSEVRVNAKEAFTEGDENGEMKKGVGGKLRELYPVGEKKTTQERMKRKLEAAKEISKKNNTPPRRRILEYLGS